MFSHKKVMCFVVAKIMVYSQNNVFCCCKNNGLVTQNKNYIQSQKQTYLLEEINVSSQNQA